MLIKFLQSLHSKLQTTLSLVIIPFCRLPHTLKTLKQAKRGRPGRRYHPPPASTPVGGMSSNLSLERSLFSLDQPVPKHQFQASLDKLIQFPVSRRHNSKTSQVSVSFLVQSCLERATAVKKGPELEARPRVAQLRSWVPGGRRGCTHPCGLMEDELMVRKTSRFFKAPSESPEGRGLRCSQGPPTQH